MRRITLATALAVAAALPASAGAALVHGDLGAARGGAVRTATIALRHYAQRLGVDASAFRFTSVRHSLIGTHVRGAQFTDGLEVDGSAAVVSIVRGRVVWVEAEQVAATGHRSASIVSGRSANIAALRRVGVGVPTQLRSWRLLVRHAGRLVDTYRVSVFALRPAVAATVDVAAASGRVLAVRNTNRYDNAVGTVFDPNPIVTSRDNTLREPGVDLGGVDTDLDSAALTAQLRDLPIRDYDPTQAPAGRLVGPWVQVQGDQPYVQVNAGRFELTRGQPGFEGLMAYAHIDRYQRYLQDTLGFKGAAAVNAEPQDLYALHIEGYDNSFYQPGNDLMVLGAGGVDDGEDAEVILHEYGHAMQDDQVPGWGANNEGGAMGEGFGDFQSGAYYARTSGGFQDVCLMDWDSTSYSSANPPCIRRMDSTKVWPKDKANEVHDDGEIWETYLWRLRSHLGTDAIEMSDNGLKLVISSHELLDKNATFAKAVTALGTAAKALGHPEWVAYVNSEAKVSGFIK